MTLKVHFLVDFFKTLRVVGVQNAYFVINYRWEVDMDNVKIGKFIKFLRKEKGLTQTELADKLSLSDKTISKWETGNGLPDVSLMIPLCDILGVSVNELLSGERLDEESYKNKAEENIINIMKDKKTERKKFILINALALTFCFLCCGIFMLAGLLDVEDWVRIVLIVLGFVVLFSGIFMFCELDRQIGYFECKNCGHRFEPTLIAYINGVHTIKKRYLKCPNCGKRTWCTRRMSEKEN